MCDSVPSPRYSPVCNVLRQWKTSLIPTYRVYRLYDKRVFRVAVNTYVPIFWGLQTCNGEYTKHCTRSRHQLKMAAPAEVSKRRSNFRIRQFKEKRHYNIAANLTFNTTVSFVALLIARTARIACASQTYIHTHTHTHTQDDYCNPLCACTPRVNKAI